MVGPTKEQVQARFSKRFREAVDAMVQSGELTERGKWSQLARRLGISYQGVRKYYDGEAMPTASRMPAVSAAVHRSVPYLRGDIDADDPLLAELQALWESLPDASTRAQVVGFAKGLLGGRPAQKASLKTA